MIEFSEIALKIISDYKLLLRKIYPIGEATMKIRDLGLKRNQLDKHDSVFIYNVVKRIIEHLSEYVTEKKKSHAYFFGAEELLQYTSDFMSDYQVFNDKLIHTSREASRAVIDVIQIVSLPEGKLTKDIFERLSKCVSFVSKYGKMEHITLLNEAMKQNRKTVTFLMQQYSEKKNIEDFF